jgi:hypothetical protein
MRLLALAHPTALNRFHQIWQQVIAFFKHRTDTAKGIADGIFLGKKRVIMQNYELNIA